MNKQAAKIEIRRTLAFVLSIIMIVTMVFAAMPGDAYAEDGAAPPADLEAPGDGPGGDGDSDIVTPPEGTDPAEDDIGGDSDAEEDADGGVLDPALPDEGEPAGEDDATADVDLPAQEDEDIAALVAAPSLTIDPIANQTYDGTAKTPALTVKYNDGSSDFSLVKDTDYTIVWTNNINAGTATVKITGKNTYPLLELMIQQANFTILPADLSKLKIEKIADQSHSGSAKKPAVTIKNGNTLLVANKDYTAAYSKNKNIGKATVKITGKGNYTGSKSATFRILPKTTAVSKMTQGTKIFTVTWKKVSGITKYEVQYRVAGTSKWKTKSVSSKKTSVSINVIKDSKLHEVRVRAYKKVSNVKYAGVWSATAYAASAPGSVAKLDISGWYGSAYGWPNWATPDRVYYYTDKGGNIGVVFYNAQGGLVVNTYKGTNYQRLSTKSISLAEFPIFGGFYAGPDGYFYVLSGRDNLKETDSLKVVSVRKYDANWNLIRTGYVEGGASQSFKGIYQPFAAGSPSMVLSGSTLIVHMSRTMYIHSDGLHHQSNLTFEVDTKTMQTKTFDQANIFPPYSSHSFNQFVTMSGNDLVFADHGDAFPRAVKLSVIKNYATGGKVLNSYNIFKFNGAVGNNYTGAEVTGLEAGNGMALTIGRSVPHSNAVKGVKGENGIKNVYAISTNLSTGKSTFKWITTYSPSGTTEASEPRIVKLNEKQFVILFNTVKGDGTVQLQYRLLNETGKVLKSASYDGFTYYAGSDPILIGSTIYWGSSANGNGYLNAINVANPKIPVILPGRA
ncbi:MAG: fibronectin type III domain-containing protein [Clostridiales Family XIII bacterium]|jgi:hypothetical protein|nr:fibronectin type III domain-containing protein [Clostridiales Family XIII bacterium]